MPAVPNTAMAGRNYDLGLFDQRGNLTNLLLKGELFTIKEKIRFHTDIQSPIFTYTIKDEEERNLTGTNTMFEGTKDSAGEKRR